MLSVDFYLVQQMAEMKVAEHVREAEKRRLIRQMGGGQPVWLVLVSCWLLSRVGRIFISLGQWLQQSAAHRSLAAKRRQPLGYQ